jgi:hypothetical protein
MKTEYWLEIKKSPEVISKCSARSLTEAILFFSEIKKLNPNSLLEIYKVYESPNGKRQLKKEP